MPLSDKERKILADIERNLHKTDPSLAREVSEKTVYRHAMSSLKAPIAGMLVGLLVMAFTIQIHYLFAFLGFLVMFASALGFERHLRMMSKAGANQFAKAFRAANLDSDAEELAEESDLD